MRTVVSWIRCSVLAEVSCHPIRVRRATRKAATWIKTSQKRGHEFCSLMVKPLWCRVLEASSTSSRTVGPGVDTQGYRPYWTNTRTLTLESARCTVLHSCDEETYGVVLVKSCLIYVPVWSQQLECMFLFIQSTELTGEEFHYQKCWCCLATSTFTDAFLFFFTDK